MITILCSGSRGDIQPYIALAQQIKGAGSDVRIAAGNSFRGFVERYGIAFYPLSADYKSVDIDPKLLKAAQSSDNPLKMLLTFNKMKKYAAFMTEEMYDACVGSSAIVYHPGCAIGYFAGELLGIPSVMASLFPLHKTSAYPSVIAYGRYKLPAAWTYPLLQQMLWMAAKTGITGFLKQKLGRLPRDFACPYEKVDGAHPAVISCSNHVFPRPDDWNANVHQYGYWQPVETQDYAVPQALRDFLSRGEKPVYIGFGSVFHEEETVTYLLLITGARRGEIAGLTWDNVDFDNNSIYITRSLLYSPDAGLFFDTPKTKKSRRVISIPAEVASLLREYRAWQLEMRLASGDQWHEQGHVFTQDNGDPMHPDSISGWLAKFAKRRGLPHIHPHMFRHTMASQLLGNGENAVAVSRRLGHSRTSTTSDIYAHALAEADARAAEKAADILLRG